MVFRGRSIKYFPAGSRASRCDPGGIFRSREGTRGANGRSDIHCLANIEEAQAFYADVKGRMAKYGRSPEELKIMPGVFPVIGRTEEEAEENKRLLEELIPEEAGILFYPA